MSLDQQVEEMDVKPRNIEAALDTHRVMQNKVRHSEKSLPDNQVLNLLSSLEEVEGWVDGINTLSALQYRMFSWISYNLVELLGRLMNLVGEEEYWWEGGTVFVYPAWIIVTDLIFPVWDSSHWMLNQTNWKNIYFALSVALC